jgi:hypothetical protein
VCDAFEEWTREKELPGDCLIALRVDIPKAGLLVTDHRSAIRKTLSALEFGLNDVVTLMVDITK